MHRFYADERGICNGVAYLPQEDAQHAARVLRLAPGDEAELFAEGGRYACRMKTVSPQEVSVDVLSPLPSTEAALRVTLYQGLPKADKMELIVQKACELGASHVIPVAMSRCVVKLDGKDGKKKQERWQKIAREACKQSGRCVEMQVHEPLSYKAFLEALSTHQAAIVPWEDARNLDLVAFRNTHPTIHDLAIVIGPEGGMSPEEIDQMMSVGCSPITLGPRILRTETAGLCTLSVLFALYPETLA